MSAPDATAAATQPLLEVVIVSYGNADMVLRCVASVLANSPRGGRLLVHVVDNHSPDETPDIIESTYPTVDLRRSSWNSGFSRANNMVLRGIEAPYVLVLNPDTELREGVLDQLLEHFDRDPSIGVVGCRLETADGTFDHASKRAIPTLRGAAQYFAHLSLARTRSSQYLAPQVDERGVGDVQAINGAFMLIRTAAMAQVGYLDERYWMYGEDLDWCVRFREAGWRILYDGRVTVLHLKGAVSGRTRTLRLNWHFHKSMVIFYRTHLGGRRRAVDTIVAIAIYCRFTVVSATSMLRRAFGRLARA